LRSASRLPHILRFCLMALAGHLLPRA
jgi:hypothetical protein